MLPTHNSPAVQVQIPPPYALAQGTPTVYIVRKDSLMEELEKCVRDHTVRIQRLEDESERYARSQNQNDIDAIVERHAANLKRNVLRLQVWSLAQEAIDDLLYSQCQAACRQAGFTSGCALRFAHSQRATRPAVQSIFASAPRDLYVAELIARCFKAGLSDDRHQIAQRPRVSVSQLEELAREHLDEAVITLVGQSLNSDGQRRFAL
ncbi:hypothetical protein DFH06DRAFT_1214324 [Mycena polygramma]|nr:hypothetical protein DFH06DRAFT_1214324 [Mycena polygramma]